MGARVPNGDLPILTPAEEDVAKLTVQGLTAKEMGGLLGKKAKTVYAQEQAIAEKWDIKIKAIGATYRDYVEQQQRKVWPDFAGEWRIAVVVRRLSAHNQHAELYYDVTLGRVAGAWARYRGTTIEHVLGQDLDPRRMAEAEVHHTSAFAFEDDELQGLLSRLKSASRLDLEVRFDPSEAPRSASSWRSFALTWLNTQGDVVVRAPGKINQGMNRLRGDIWITTADGDAYISLGDGASLVLCLRRDAYEEQLAAVAKHWRAGSNLMEGLRRLSVATRRSPFDISLAECLAFMKAHPAIQVDPATARFDEAALFRWVFFAAKEKW